MNCEKLSCFTLCESESLPALRAKVTHSKVTHSKVIKFLLLIFLLVFRKFIQSLPATTRIMFILAGSIYVGGAIGMEMVGGYIADTYGFNTFAYGMAARIEELLEMLGILIFINQLLVYLQSLLTDIHFSLSFRTLKSKSF